MPSPIQIADNEGLDAQAVLSDLARVKAAFQLRAVTTVITGAAFGSLNGATAAGSQAHRPAADNFRAAIGNPDAGFCDFTPVHASEIARD